MCIRDSKKTTYRIVKYLSVNRKLISRLLYAILVIVAVSCSEVKQDYDFTIYNISIIDPVKKETVPNKTIYIKDGKIAKIEDSNDNHKSNGNSSIDGTNKFAIAGLWNMHTHICWKGDLNETIFPVLLSYGITGVRDMGGDLDILNRFKKQLLDDPSSGPNLYGPGPLIDGENPIHPDFSVALTDQNYKLILDSLYDRNIDFIKVYSLLSKDLVRQISQYSKDKNISFAGHISEYITPTEAAELQQKSFEHLNRIEDIRNDSLALKTFIATVKANNSWLCPTLLIYKRKIEIAQGKDLYHPLYDLIDEYLKNEWSQIKKKREGATSNPDKLEKLESIYKEQKELVKLFYKNNMQLLLGSDFGGMAFVYPGYSLHEEMALMQELGFDTYDILKMATYNPAVFFELTDTHGQIEKGKVADLVILNTDPVSDISNTLDINTVIKSGKIVKRQK